MLHGLVLLELPRQRSLVIHVVLLHRALMGPCQLREMGQKRLGINSTCASGVVVLGESAEFLPVEMDEKRPQNHVFELDRLHVGTCEAGQRWSGDVGGVVGRYNIVDFPHRAVDSGACSVCVCVFTWKASTV